MQFAFAALCCFAFFALRVFVLPQSTRRARKEPQWNTKKAELSVNQKPPRIVRA
jgi:hypothetical protein